MFCLIISEKTRKGFGLYGQQRIDYSRIGDVFHEMFHKDAYFISGRGCTQLFEG